MKHRLILLGISIPTIFWLTTFICSLRFDDYNHFSNLVSELGALGSDSQYLFTGGLVLCSLLSILFVMDLLITCKLNKIGYLPALIILTFSFSIAGAGIFPMPTTLHGIMGLPSILLVTSPLLAYIIWGNSSGLKYIKTMSIISFVVMMLGFLTFLPDFYGEFTGLKQRFFHLGWSIWFIYLGISFQRLKDSLNSNKVVNL